MDKNAPYVLLALCGVGPDDNWNAAQRLLLGISQIMEFLSTRYDLHYAPNTREMIRKGPIKELLSHNIIELNPDNKQRPVNSGKTVYAIHPKYIEKLKSL